MNVFEGGFRIGRGLPVELDDLGASGGNATPRSRIRRILMTSPAVCDFQECIPASVHRSLVLPRAFSPYSVSGAIPRLCEGCRPVSCSEAASPALASLSQSWPPARPGRPAAAGAPRPGIGWPVTRLAASITSRTLNPCPLPRLQIMRSCVLERQASTCAFARSETWM